jgi:hypothetical protein
MWTFIDKIPYTLLIIAALFMLLAPFQPMPHVIEKMTVRISIPNLTFFRVLLSS